MILLSSMIFESLASHYRKPGVVIVAETTPRMGDSESYAPSFDGPVYSGEEVTLIETRPGWYHVRLSDGSTCWLRSDTVELLDTGQ